MDPDACAESLGVLASVRHVVLVREKDVCDAAGVLEPLHKLRSIARRIDEEMARRGVSEARRSVKEARGGT